MLYAPSQKSFCLVDHNINVTLKKSWSKLEGQKGYSTPQPIIGV